MISEVAENKVMELTKYTTLNEIKRFKPCREGWTLLLKGLDKTHSDDEPLAFTTILEINGIDDAIWSLRVSKQNCVAFACACACSVIDIFESKNDSKVMRYAIEIASNWENEATTDIMAAYDAAAATARAAAATARASANAAYAAAYAADTAYAAADAANAAADTANAAYTAYDAADAAARAVDGAADTANAAYTAYDAADAAARAVDGAYVAALPAADAAAVPFSAKNTFMKIFG